MKNLEMTKSEIINALEILNVEFDKNATKKELAELYNSLHEPVEEEVTEQEQTDAPADQPTEEVAEVKETEEVAEKVYANPADLPEGTYFKNRFKCLHKIAHKTFDDQGKLISVTLKRMEGDKEVKVPAYQLKANVIVVEDMEEVKNLLSERVEEEGFKKELELLK